VAALIRLTTFSLPAADNLLGLLVVLSIGAPFFRSDDLSTLRRGGSYLEHQQLRGEGQGRACR
jgi:hypothetical protein